MSLFLNSMSEPGRAVVTAALNPVRILSWSDGAPKAWIDRNIFSNACWEECCSYSDLFVIRDLQDCIRHSLRLMELGHTPVRDHEHVFNRIEGMALQICQLRKSEQAGLREQEQTGLREQEQTGLREQEQTAGYLEVTFYVATVALGALAAFGLYRSLN